MAKQSAGILLYRRRSGTLEVLIVHPGGPLWAKRDRGAWSIPKGELDPGEEPELAAAREFTEELGHPLPAGPRIELGEVVQGGGKRVRAWAVEGDLDPATVVSGTFEMQWPPRSEKTAIFPEVDRAAWEPLERATDQLIPAQVAFLTRLTEALGHRPG